MELFDSHAHYFDRRFFSDENPKGVDALLCEDVFGEGIDGVINVGTNNKNNVICIEQAKSFDKMYAAVGIHPEDVGYAEQSISEEIKTLADMLDTEEKRSASKIVALGEIGLDYHYEGFDKTLQQKYFDAQMSLAEELDIPVIIHDREAHGDCFETVLRYPKVRGVFHSFSGSAEMARELVKRGWYISFSGVVTFKNVRKTVEAAAIVPTDRILVETDAPYLAPHPFRGRLNHSGYVKYTAEKIADIKQQNFHIMVSQIRQNVTDLFGI